MPAVLVTKNVLYPGLAVSPDNFPPELCSLSDMSFSELSIVLQMHLEGAVSIHRQTCAADAVAAAAQARAQIAEARAVAAEERQAVLSWDNAALHAQRDVQVSPLAILCCD